jgi:hypothetical protein
MHDLRPLQVFKALAQLCVRALERHPLNTSHRMANSALAELLQAAFRDSALGAGVNLAAATLKQLQDAGLLQHLSALMTHAAHDLATEVAAAVTVPDLDSSSNNHSAADGPMFREPGVAGTIPSGAHSAAQHVPAIANATQLLRISYF